MIRIKNAKKCGKRLMTLLLLLGAMFVMPAIALSWPTNHLDSSATGNKPYCTSCHSYQSGYLSLEKINGVTPMGTTVTANQNSGFTLDFRSVGLGYGRFSVAGVVQLPGNVPAPATGKFAMSIKPGGDVPWFIGQQATTWGAPINSPWNWVTAFSENNNPNAQKGVTLDDGTTAPAAYTDRNETAHNEPFSVNIFVYDTVPFGTYNLKLIGVGTASNGRLAYNEKNITLIVTNDTNPPEPPTYLPFDNITTSAIRVKWSHPDPSDINGYNIYRATAASGPFEYIAYSYDTNYTDRDLMAGTEYFYRIKAVDNAGNTRFAAGTGSATTLSGARTDAVRPAAPTGLSAFLVSVDQDVYKKTVKLTWDANPEADIIGYSVYRATSPSGPFSLLTTSAVSTFTSSVIDATYNIVADSVYYVDHSTRYGTVYYYKVTAVDVVGNVSDMTSYVSITPVVDVGSPNPHGNYRSKNGMCQNCHSLHSSSGKELIFYKSITDSCYTCHDGSQSKFNTKAAFDTVNNPSHHKIPEGRYSCDVCHNPHYDSQVYPKLLAAESKEDGQIKRDGNDFCYACHGRNSDLHNPFGRNHHDAFEVSRHNSLNPSSQATGIVCRNCHVPHGSRDYPLLVSANSDNFCISCHKNSGFVFNKVYQDPDPLDPDPIKRVYGTELAGVYVTNFSNDYAGTQHNKNFYGRNTCTMCHEPHGSLQNRYMLNYPYKDYYETETVGGKVYGPINYAGNAEEGSICFRCHDSQYYVGINGDYNRVTLGSRFGNGNAKNYHTHSAKWKVSCRTCHDPHSGKSAYEGTVKQAGYPWILNNDHYINFDWNLQVGIATYSSQNNRLGFIPKYDQNGSISGYSCAIKCHSKDHSKGGGAYQNYTRTSNSPPVKCNGCHDFDVFDKNSRHPVLEASPGGKTVTCEQCHIADHMQHNKTNPYGLQQTIVSNWIYQGVPQPITTSLRQIDDPVSGKKIPAYGEMCWQCHGSTPGRDILGDHKTLFETKPHSLLQRTGTANPYGAGLDSPCLTCHYHHASTNMRLLRPVIDGEPIDAETLTGKINACLACHDGSPAPYDVRSKYNAASSAGHFIKSDHDKKMLCTECHDSHGSTNKMYLLDTANKYNTGITFERNRTGAGSRWFCLACHPLWGEPGRESGQVYNTVYTVGAGVVTIQPLPSTVRDHVYNSGTAKECAICHDPHKPWPATGGEDKCYSCHSRPNGEATDIKAMMGLTSLPGTGMLSKHPITDADSVNNTCSVNCHTNHPHPERADHLQHLGDPFNVYDNERTLCLGCHAKTVNPAKSPYTIDAVKYFGKKHDYPKVIRIYPADNSSFYGNCDKCHVPHGSDYKPLLRSPKDELCLGCHDGIETDQNGEVIEDIKTMYNRAGHTYTSLSSAKMYCDECHVPHGSTSDMYLRDNLQLAPRQSMTYVGEVVYSVYFPGGLTGANYNTRLFCVTCHREYVAANVFSWVYYISETTPGGEVRIANIPLVGDHGVQINEHKIGNAKKCTDCHNPHDPEPVGSNKDCFICHGYASGQKGYAVKNAYNTVIEDITGLNGAWPGTPKISYHPITDANTPVLNDCMNMCHTKHVHNPRAKLIKDKRPDVNDVTSPAAPTLAAVPSSANQVDVKVYAPASTDIVGYYVYRSADNVTWSKYATVNAKIVAPAYLWFYDGGLSEGQQVYYKASAFDRRGNISALSPVVSAVTSQSADTTKPDIPLNVAAAQPSQSSLLSTGAVISWSLSRDNYEMGHYNIYRSATDPDDLGTYTLVGSTGGTSFTEGSLAPNTTYYYRLTAVDAVGNESSKSAWVSVKTSRANQVNPGYYSYKDGSSTVTMRVYGVDGTPTNSFARGSQINVEIITPKNYFGRLAGTHARDTIYANMNFYRETSKPVYNVANTASPYGSPALTLTTGGTPTTDIYLWSGQVPLTGSMYQLTVEMAVYDRDTYYYNGDGSINSLNTRYWTKRFMAKEAIFVTPTSRYMKTYSDPARTTESLTFKPGDTVYMTLPSLTSTSWPSRPAYVGLYVYNATQTGTSDSDGSGNLIPQTSFDSSKAILNLSYTLPASGLVDNCWYSIGASGGGLNNWYSKLTDLFRQILVRNADTVPPSAPSSLSVSSSDQHRVSLTWTGSTDSFGVAGYSVFRKKSTEGSYVLAGTTAVDTLSFDVTGLDPNTLYNFKVTAFDAVGNDSGDSNVVNRTTNPEAADGETPNVPSGISVVVNSYSSMTVSWNWNTTSRMDQVTAYSVYRSQNNLDYLKVGSVNSAGLTGDQRLSFTDNYLFGNTKYYYKVAAFDKVGNSSAFSTVLSRTTKRTGDDSIEGALCMSCHEGTTAPPPGYTVIHKIGSAYNKSKHNSDYDLITFKDGSIYKGNCTKCHDPHGSDFNSLLKKDDGIDLCIDCHESASESGKYSGKRDYELSAHGRTVTSTVYHSSTPKYWPGGTGVDSPVTANTPEDAGKCYNCHSPHGRYDPVTGEYIKSSTWAGSGTNLNRLCFTCHNDDPGTFYGEWHGKTVYGATFHGDATVNMKMKLTDSLGVEWGAGECANCHDPHGTQISGMLRYPVNVAGANMNQLCLKCHDRSDILADTGLFDGSAVYVNSKHGQKAQWLEEYNVGGVVYNKTTFQVGVCLNCHNSHGKSTDNSADASKVIPKMLVIQDGPDNEICNRCHESPSVNANQPGYSGNTLYQLSAHHGTTRPGVLWPGGTYYEEPQAEATRGKCINCHDPHGAAKTDQYGNVINIPGATFDEEEKLCYACHKAGVLPPIYDLARFDGPLSGHWPGNPQYVNIHAYGEDLNSKPRHVECLDCHNTHVAETTFGITNLDQRLPKVLKGTSGIKITSWPAPNVPDWTKTGVGEWREKPVETDSSLYQFQVVTSDDPNFEEYMLCFKCHSTYAPASGGKRVAAFMNPKNLSTHGFRMEKNPSNFLNKALSMTIDGNPVADYLFTPGTPFNPNPDINVLGEARRFKVTCSDCHGNSDPTGPKGPHGSNYDYMLKVNPMSVDFCTSCHYTKGYFDVDPLYVQYSFFTMHSTWHYGFNIGSVPPLVGSRRAEGYENFAKYFGNNGCRACHFAGQYQGDVTNISTHGENASTLGRNTQYYETTSYRVYRGLNGYILDRCVIPSDGGSTYGGCSTNGLDGGLYCGAHS